MLFCVLSVLLRLFWCVLTPSLACTYEHRGIPDLPSIPLSVPPDMRRVFMSPLVPSVLDSEPLHGIGAPSDLRILGFGPFSGPLLFEHLQEQAFC